MKSRKVAYDDQANLDLLAIFNWLAETASPISALRIIDDLQEFIAKLDIASERGTRRDDLLAGIRTLGHGNATIAFVVDDDTITVLRIFYGGQNWESALSGRRK